MEFINFHFLEVHSHFSHHEMAWVPVSRILQRNCGLKENFVPPLLREQFIEGIFMRVVRHPANADEWNMESRGY